MLTCRTLKLNKVLLKGDISLAKTFTVEFKLLHNITFRNLLLNGAHFNILTARIVSIVGKKWVKMTKSRFRTEGSDVPELLAARVNSGN